MLGQHWSSIASTCSIKYQPNVVLLLGQRRRRWANITAKLGQCVVFNGIPTNTRHQPNVGSMLVHRLRRWPSIDPAMGERVVFVWMFYSQVETFNQRCITVGPVLQTMGQHWSSIGLASPLCYLRITVTFCRIHLRSPLPGWGGHRSQTRLTSWKTLDPPVRCSAINLWR